jgi:hypothetical protein
MEGPWSVRGAIMQAARSVGARGILLSHLRNHAIRCYRRLSGATQPTGPHEAEDGTDRPERGRLPAAR